MKKVALLISNDVFSGVLLKPLFSEHPEWIFKVYIEKAMTGNRTPLQVFFYVVKKSGFRYAFYQSVELIGYQILANLKSILHKRPSILPVNQAIAKGIKVMHFSPKEWMTVVEELKQTKPDVVLCIRFSKILKKDVLSIPKYGAINFHGSLLPKYAGLGSVLQAVRFQERELGGTFHTMTEDIDTGLILNQNSIPNDVKSSISNMYLTVYKECGKFLINVIREITERNRDIYTVCGRETYFSFPEKLHVKEARKYKNLLRIVDFVRAWKDF